MKKLKQDLKTVTSELKKLVKKRRPLKRKSVKSSVQKKKTQMRKKVQRKNKVQKRKSIKGRRKGRVVGSFVKRKDVLS